jgi:acetamidase/formamidase
MVLNLDYTVEILQRGGLHNGAEPGDVIAVDILDIRSPIRESPAHAGMRTAFGRHGSPYKSGESHVMASPISTAEISCRSDIGVIGLAPDGEPVADGFRGTTAKYGQQVIKKALVYFPVRVAGGFFRWATPRDYGRLRNFGTGIEIRAKSW